MIYEMCPIKGDTTNTNFPISFDRYEFLQELGQGSFCTVYLVRHTSLEQERVLKCYHKASTPSASDLMEARILRDLVHPGIPLIYDLQEDDDFFYVIEEYVQGENLDEFLLHQSFVSEDFFYKFSLQLCDIFHYLHSRSHSPVLYRDLKPEHLILNHGEVRLVDFNISSFADSSADNLDCYGNLTFSAPESRIPGAGSPSSDIYSIGKLLDYLLDHLEKKPPRKLRIILKKAMQEDPSLRYETVEELSAALWTEQQKTHQTHLRKTIAVVGSHRGCGCTHLATALVSFLNFSGISAVYYEKNKSDSLRNAAEFQKHMKEQDGCYRYRFFTGIPDYGPGVQLPSPEADAAILDLGTDPLDFPEECDLILLLATGGIWRRHNLIEQYGLLEQLGVPVKIIGNFCSRRQLIELALLMGLPVYHYPFSDDPYGVNRKSIRLFGHLLKIKRGIRRKKGCFLPESEPPQPSRSRSGSQESVTTPE